MKIVRFIISGGTGAATNIGILFLFTDVFQVWYVYSSVVAFLGSSVVSFILQKFWAFKDHSRDNIHKQAAMYFLVLLSGLGTNTFILYILVEFAGLHYLMAQIIGSALVAFWSYFAYQRFIFKKLSLAKELK